MNPRIARILDVKPLLVTVEWTNGQITSIDFAKFLANEKSKNSIYSRLYEEDIFAQVKTDGRTLYWDEMAEMIDTDGSKISAPIDFCPDVLYTFSG